MKHASGKRAQTSGHRRNVLREDSRGSVHVMETMIVGLMVVGAVVAVSTLNVPVSHTEGYKVSQERIVQDALDSLLAQPAQDSSVALFGSLLEEYLMKAVAGDSGPLMSYMNRTLPAGAHYNIYLDNGFGRPVPVVLSGRPVGEAVAGSSTFVPRMAYVFLQPEFGVYQDDFHMNVLAIPMHNSIMQRDEGDPVELAVTIVGDNGAPVTLRTYGHTALRMNDPDARSWPGVSMYVKGEKTGACKDTRWPAHCPTHYVPSTALVPYAGFLENLQMYEGDGRFGDAYNVTFTTILHEAAGHNVPRGATITLEFPRGWDFGPKKKAYVESHPDLGNAEYWHEFQWNGSVGTGWTVKATLKDPFKSGEVPFTLSGNFVMLLDSSYPHFQPIVVQLGKGVQGQMTVLLQTPQPLDAGGFRHEAYVSTSKPLISGAEAIWGMSFANMGAPSASFLLGAAEAGSGVPTGSLRVLQVELKQPQGMRIFEDVAHEHGWVPGTWDKSAPGHFIWTPSNPATATVPEGEGAHLTFSVRGGPTKDNHYRNHDYQNVTFAYDPTKNLGGSTSDWVFEQRAHQMGAEWVYRQLVPPYENESDGFLGWPDEAASYWFKGQAQQQRRSSVGNASYEVDTVGALSQLAGDYQGAHVYSRTQIVNQMGAATRSFGLDERVHIKNDFQATFAAVSALRAGSNLDITDVKIVTSVYTPEKAWTGKPTAVFEEQAYNIEALGVFQWLFAMDLTENGILDVLAVNKDGIVAAIDGRDGSKLWIYDQFTPFQAAVLADVTADGRNELVVVDSSNHMSAVDLNINVPKVQRKLWTLPLLSTAETLSGVQPHKTTALLDLTDGTGTLGEPMLAVGVSAKSGTSWVRVVSVDGSPGAWTPAKGAKHLIDATVARPEVTVEDLERVRGATVGGKQASFVAVASANNTVTLLSLPDLGVAWTTHVPHRPWDLQAVDLYGDDHDEIVVDTGANSGQSGGNRVYVLAGRSGTLGPGLRSIPTALVGENWHPADAAFGPDGAFVTTVDGQYNLVSAQGAYGPKLSEVRSACGGIGLGGTLRWTGLHASSDGGLYMVERGGMLVRAGAACADGTLAWDTMPALTHAGASGYEAVYAWNPDAPGGVAFGLTEYGEIVRRDAGGATSIIATACTIAGGPYGCTIDGVARWHVQETASSTAPRFWAALHEGDGVRVVSFVPGGAWQDHGFIAAFDFKDMTVTPEGDAYLVGSREGVPFGRALPFGDSVWRAERFFYGNTTGELEATIMAVRFDSAGTGWAVDAMGQPWRSVEPGIWVPFAAAGFAAASPSIALAEDLDGTVWVVGDKFVHYPLATHVRSGQAVLTHKVALSETHLQQGYTELLVVSNEGHLGGTATTKPLTDVRWEFRYHSGDTWRSLARTDVARASGVHEVAHSAAVDCTANPCTDIELRATLRSRTLTETAGDFRQDAGASPAVLGGTFGQRTPLIGGGLSHTLGTFDGADFKLHADTTESATHGGLRLATEDPGWSYRGLSSTGNPLMQGEAMRFVGTSQDPLTSDMPGAGVVISERGVSKDLWGASSLNWWVLDGASGVPVRPLSGWLDRPPGYDFVDKVVIGDLTGDGITNVAFIGFFDDEAARGENSMVYVWDTEKDEFHIVSTAEDKIATAAIMTGRERGKQTLTFAQALTLSNITVSEKEEDNHLQSWYGPSGDSGPELRWESVPLGSQGHTTFTYHIPRHSMFGTAIVVSELVFEVDAGGGSTVTQTARLVDWFDILPPGQKRATPPIYTVEVVAWFPGG